MSPSLRRMCRLNRSFPSEKRLWSIWSRCCSTCKQTINNPPASLIDLSLFPIDTLETDKMAPRKSVQITKANEPSSQASSSKATLDAIPPPDVMETITPDYVPQPRAKVVLEEADKDKMIHEVKVYRLIQRDRAHSSSPVSTPGVCATRLRAKRAMGFRIR